MRSWRGAAAVFRGGRLTRTVGAIGAEQSPTTGGDDQNAIFVHIYSEDRQVIFSDEGKHLALELSGSKSPTEEGSISVVETANFASFFSTSPIPRGSKLVLSGLRGDAKVEFFVADQFGASLRKLPPGSIKVLYQFGVRN